MMDPSLLMMAPSLRTLKLSDNLLTDDFVAELKAVAATKLNNYLNEAAEEECLPIERRLRGLIPRRMDGASAITACRLQALSLAANKFTPASAYHFAATLGPDPQAIQQVSERLKKVSTALARRKARVAKSAETAVATAVVQAARMSPRDKRRAADLAKAAAQRLERARGGEDVGDLEAEGKEGDDLSTMESLAAAGALRVLDDKNKAEKAEDLGPTRRVRTQDGDVVEVDAAVVDGMVAIDSNVISLKEELWRLEAEKATLLQSESALHSLQSLDLKWNSFSSGGTHILAVRFSPFHCSSCGCLTEPPRLFAFPPYFLELVW